MSFPAAPGEVPEVSLPEPRTRELAVNEQERLPAGATLGEPGLDVQAAVEELDLVFANWPAGRGRDLRSGQDVVGRRLGHPRSTVQCFTTHAG